MLSYFTVLFTSFVINISYTVTEKEKRFVLEEAKGEGFVLKR